MRLGILLMALAVYGESHSQPATALELFDEMRESLWMPPNASLEQTVQIAVTWQGISNADIAASSGTVADHWRVLSDSERVGLERYRESPVGTSRIRTVHLPKEQQNIFTFDLDAPEGSAVVGQLSIRHRILRGPFWRTPIFDYIDTVFSMRGRYPRSFLNVKSMAEHAMIDGHSCHEVQGNWNGRDFTLWLDPEFGYLPRKYTLRADVRGELDFGNRGGPEISYERLLEAPTRGDERGRPRSREEKLTAVTLEKLDGQPYMAKATLERTMFFSRDVTYTERIEYTTDSFALAIQPDTAEFLGMDNLLVDDTPVEVLKGDIHSAERSERQYVMDEGELVPAGASFRGYFSKLALDLKRLAGDFSLENLRQVDSKFLVAMCATLALLLNGGIAYASHRRKKAEPGEDNA